MILDNNISSFYFNLNNGIPIGSFYDNKNDKELAKIGNFLLNLERKTEVKRIISEVFKIEKCMIEIKSRMETEMG